MSCLNLVLSLLKGKNRGNEVGLVFVYKYKIQVMRETQKQNKQVYKKFIRFTPLLQSYEEDNLQYPEGLLLYPDLYRSS